ncbi:hypothetical protein BpHYR1_008798 [Brachionus plicatilis]|uniref:Uncharacterized protein n=1 Tax=Brachionus plicatilis TaxID=10195 RepID=A0A3M7PX69_BRAPC|nr:hypothetical protein BpHYR1_008798 [Brachionus plicatilis]
MNVFQHQSIIDKINLKNRKKAIERKIERRLDEVEESNQEILEKHKENKAYILNVDNLRNVELDNIKWKINPKSSSFWESFAKLSNNKCESAKP